MKKQYIAPAIQTVIINTCVVIATSGIHAIAGKTNRTINYGGIDYEGELNAASRQNDWWDDAMEED